MTSRSGIPRSEIQLRIRDILHEFRDIFSYNVKGKAMAVPPMTFTVDTVNWEAPENRLPSRHISVVRPASRSAITGYDMVTSTSSPQTN
jgi:hypothetical protein